MSNIYYLKNTLDNMESWFDGFCLHMREHTNNETDFEAFQLITLYESMISDIIEHAKNLVHDIEEEVIRNYVR